MADETIVYVTPNRATPGRPVVFDPSVCDGCNRCVIVCLEDVLAIHPKKGQPPLVLHPEECWYCGPCVDDCPLPGAIRLNHPLQQRVRGGTNETPSARAGEETNELPPPLAGEGWGGGGIKEDHEHHA